MHASRLLAQGGCAGAVGASQERGDGLMGRHWELCAGVAGLGIGTGCRRGLVFAREFGAMLVMGLGGMTGLRIWGPGDTTAPRSTQRHPAGRLGSADEQGYGSGCIWIQRGSEFVF